MPVIEKARMIIGVTIALDWLTLKIAERFDFRLNNFK